MNYAELHVLSNFTFLRGASRPEELVKRAHELGYRALALTDECSLAGVVRAFTAARELNFHLIIGSEIQLADGPRLVALATTRDGYRLLCQLITKARRAAPKGNYRLTREDLAFQPLTGLEILWIPGAQPDLEEGAWLSSISAHVWLAVELLATGLDRARLATLTQAGLALNIPLVAAGDVHMHVRERRRLQDVLTAIRIGKTVDNAGFELYPNAERCLRSLRRLDRLYPAELLQATQTIADRCHFSLAELRYEYPDEIVPAGHTPSSWLRTLSLEGARQRWPDGIDEHVNQLLEHELALIAELGYEPYFLTVWDIVNFARGRSILCQGRGSAANSAVCYCLGITEVDPARMSLLFERFISKERNEPPDIDIDFEHERREEVIQYVYQKYGRHRAANTAAVISYRGRSAIRDVGKALGLDSLQVDKLARTQQWWDGKTLDEARIREAGLDPHSPILKRCVELVHEITGFPRHLSQHVGGFVIARHSLDEWVPVENASMAERTVIQWDKDDLDELGLLKVDLLALGMLTAISKALVLASDFRGYPLTMASIPAEDPAVYEMVSKADTVGVFQIESRAQMAMLPRLRPQSFYDLVIEVALVRPGPIQGDMVHPYLRRRNGEEPVSYPSAEVRSVLQRTLGVPIFQEQVMSLAVVAAGFTPGEADRLRRAMAAWKRKGGLGGFEARLLDGMKARGYREEFAQAIFNQMSGFGEYGFPESHAASFALLVYLSAWLKCHEPAAFTAALLNSQPMGFYAPAQLVRDARTHGVEVRPVDIRYSQVDCTLERQATDAPAIRLGFRLVNGLSRQTALRMCELRAQAAFVSVDDLSLRAELNRRDLSALAAAGALKSLTGHRHLAVWSVLGTEKPLPMQAGVPNSMAVTNPSSDIRPMLPTPTEGEDLLSDYRSLGLTLGRHPLALLRRRLDSVGMVSAQHLDMLEHGAWVRCCGLVLMRQRPGTAGGVTFVTLEDETGVINLIVWKSVAQRWRQPLLRARLLDAQGQLQRQGSVMHLIVRKLVDRTALLGRLALRSRDFH